MKSLDSISQSLRTNGYFVQKRLDKEIGVDIKGTLSELDELASRYSEKMVQDKIFRPRENHPSRKGDSVMTTVGEPKYAPFLKLQNKKPNLGVLQNFYNDILENYFGENMSNTRCLLNWQEYKQGGDNSLPFHVDSEFFSGEWGKQYIDIERALIPKFVMVMVTENDNNGAGLEISSNGETIGLKLEPGDMVIFDNQKVMHGVPKSTPNKRSMVGFRNFEAYPLYFEKNMFDGSNEYENGHVKGFTKMVNVEETQDILLKEGVAYA